jgi:hypothetical protein
MRVARIVIAALTGAGFIFASSLAAQAQTAPTATGVVATGPGTAAGAVTLEATAKVTAVDAANRTITLKRANGKTDTIDAGKEIKNFDQIKVGDTVRARYTAALALELKKEAGTHPAGEEASHHPATEETAAATAPAGSKPGVVVGRKVTVMTHVTAVNEQKKIVTLRGPAGNEWDLDVQDPAQLKNIKKGDHVLATYVEGLVISVEEERPAAASGAKK